VLVIGADARIAIGPVESRPALVEIGPHVLDSRPGGL
jgi:hypothetical protein